MNTEQFAQLAQRSQDGDKRALTQLLRLAHTPVSFLCRKLLCNEQVAEAMTRQILSAIPKQLDSLKDPANFETWICRITASRCMQALSRMDPADLATSQPADPPVIPAKDLDEDQTAQLVQQLVDQLPDEPRICLLLYSCAGLKLKGISQLTGFPESQVLDYLNQAQKVINIQLRKYHRMGIHFAAFPALSALLRTAMYNSGDPKTAAAMANSILVKKAPAAPVRRQPRKNNNLLIAVLAAAALLLMLLVAILFLEGRRQQKPEVATAPSVTETVLSSEVTEETTLPTTEATEVPTTEPTIETTTETTVETTEDVTEAPAETTPETSAVSNETPPSQTSPPSSSTSDSTKHPPSYPGGDVPHGDQVSGGDHTHNYIYLSKSDRGATCESAGYINQICTICWEVRTVQDAAQRPPLGHDYTAKVYEPTTSSQGYTAYYCNRCGGSYKDNFVDPLPTEAPAPMETTPPETAAPAPEPSTEAAPA